MRENILNLAENYTLKQIFKLCKFNSVTACECTPAVSQLLNYIESLSPRIGIEAAQLSLLKSMLGFGKSQRDVYQELMGKLNGLLNFMQNQIENCQNESTSILYKLDQISDQYCIAYKNVKCYGGCSSDSDWTNYTVPDTLENERIFLGDFLKPLVTEEEREELEELDGKKVLFDSCREGEYLAVPWGFMLSVMTGSHLM